MLLRSRLLRLLYRSLGDLLLRCFFTCRNGLRLRLHLLNGRLFLNSWFLLHRFGLFLLTAVHRQPFLLVPGRDDLRDILALAGIYGIDDGIDGEVRTDELEAADDSAAKASHRREIRCGTESPADSLFNFGRIVHLFRTLLNLPLKRCLPGLFRKPKDGVAGGLAKDVIDG